MKIIDKLFYCTWETKYKFIKEDITTYRIGCRNKKFFTDYDPHFINYCPFCGKRIKVND